MTDQERLSVSALDRERVVVQVDDPRDRVDDDLVSR